MPDPALFNALLQGVALLLLVLGLGAVLWPRRARYLPAGIALVHAGLVLLFAVLAAAPQTTNAAAQQLRDVGLAVIVLSVLLQAVAVAAVVALHLRTQGQPLQRLRSMAETEWRAASGEDAVPAKAPTGAKISAKQGPS